ncbi:MAG: sensor histidine kinase [Merdibacter sp.]
MRIQQMTHDNKFDAEYDIEESQLDYRMLNFMLQPIVENAVKHGLEYEEEDGKGHIRIECRGEDDFIVFRVINNGGAIDLQKVAEVMRTPVQGTVFIISVNALSCIISRQRTFPLYHRGRRDLLYAETEPHIGKRLAI